MRAKLTPEVEKALVQAIRTGATLKVACQYAQVHRSTVYRWIKKGEKQSSGMYRNLSDSIKRADGMSAVGALMTIQTAAKNGSWQAAAWLLERRYGYRKDADLGEQKTEGARAEAGSESTEEYFLRQLQIAEGSVDAAVQEGSWQAAVNGQRMAITLREKLDAVRASEAGEFKVDDLDAVVSEIRELMKIPAIAEALHGVETLH